MKAYISYSHHDKASLERLITHLAQLKREGAIDEWYDRDILAGDVIDDEISARLESYDLFLALVSPDFIASDYCYHKEMERALERHESGEMRVVPIIVEPCDWKSTPLGRLKALPDDGKAVSEWTNENNAYLDVTTELRRITKSTEGFQEKDRPKEKSEPATPSRYRLKRDYDEVDRADFRRAAFSLIRDYFRESIDEINQIEDIRARYEDLGPRSFTCTILNKARKHGIAHITVHESSESYGLGDIYYSNEEAASPNTASGSFQIKSNDYDLYFEAGAFFTGETEQQMSPQDVANTLWDKFIQDAGIGYD